MAHAEDPAADKLPVTAELGDEGGSYGDATVQAETFRGELGNHRIDPKRTGPSPDTPADLPPGGAPAPPTDDVVKHASEPPDTAKR